MSSEGADNDSAGDSDSAEDSDSDPHSPPQPAEVVKTRKEAAKRKTTGEGEPEGKKNEMPEPTSWTCNKCTMENGQEDKRCSACRTWKPMNRLPDFDE